MIVDLVHVMSTRVTDDSRSSTCNVHQGDWWYTPLLVFPQVLVGVASRKMSSTWSTFLRAWICPRWRHIGNRSVQVHFKNWSRDKMAAILQTAFSDSFSWMKIVIPPASTKLKGGYTGITLSVCLSVDRIVSALYLQQYSLDPFLICTSYQAASECVSRVMSVSKYWNLKFWRIFKICNFDFVFFWLGIQYDSMVWVIIRRRGGGGGGGYPQNAGILIVLVIFWSKFNWGLFLGVQLTKRQHWFRW